jgi:hypothetical protein
MKKTKEWRVSCKKRQTMERIMTTPKAKGKIRLIMKTPPEEKPLEGVWDEVVVKVEGMGQEEVAVVAVAVRGGARNDLPQFSFSMVSHLNGTLSR